MSQLSSIDGVIMLLILSLAKMAMFKVLSKKASRMKPLVDLMATELSTFRHRGAQDRFSSVVSRGMEAIRLANY